MKNPCKGCENRHQFCHCDCEQYKSWKEEHIKEKKEIDKKIKWENFFIDQEIKRYRKKR